MRMNRYFFIGMYTYNFVLVIVNALRINREKKVHYIPGIPFIKS